MATIAKFKFIIPTENIYKINTVYNIKDITAPVSTSSGTSTNSDGNGTNPSDTSGDKTSTNSNHPSFFLYLVQDFKKPLTELTTVNMFKEGNEDGPDGTLVPTGSYKIPQVFLTNGKMEKVGFSISVEGYSVTKDGTTTTKKENTIAVDVGTNSVDVKGFLIVYDMEPSNDLSSASSDSIKHILAACESPSTLPLTGEFTIDFSQKNLWTVSETVCEG